MPYSTPTKSMHIACILCCRICRYCKATSSVQPHRFWVSYKHNGAYFILTAWLFKPFYDSYACMSCALCTLAFCSALHKDAHSPRSLSLLNDARQRKDALHHSHRSSRRLPRRTAAHHRFHQSQGAVIRVPYG